VNDSNDADAAQTITIEVDGRPIECAAGRPLLNELLNAGLVVETACGGQGSCHLCRVTVLQGEGLPVPNRIENKALGNVLLAAGLRLSCQIPAQALMRVQIPKPRPSKKRRKS